MSESRDETGMEYRDEVKGPHYTQIADVDATEFFEDESINWQYCMCHATFTHREACEFIIHAGDAEFVERIVEEMADFGCTEEFINAYKHAFKQGAVRVLFWA